MKNKTRLFKNLLNVLLFLAGMVGSLGFWELSYREYSAGSGLRLLLPYVLMVVANIVLAVSVVNPAISGFFKVSVKEATENKKRNFIYLLTILVLAVIMTVICQIWFPYGYGKPW